MDDDFQNAPADVGRLLEEIRKGSDVVFVRYPKKQHSLGRNLGSRFQNWVATRALGKPRDHYLSSFKALSRLVVDEAIRYTGPDPYLDAIILKTTRNFSVIAADHQPREHGKSGYTFRKLIALWGNMIVAFSSYPLRVIGFFGLISTAIGIAVVLYTFCGYFVDAIPVPDRLDRLSASIWIFRGVNLLFISIVGEYVGRIYQLLKHEPQFIVRSVHSRRP
jgi:undecaprenyl-phosphate 4-deoxy-4-formamido-L-arabinose transferase